MPEVPNADTIGAATSGAAHERLRRLDRLFAPASIALIGVSEDPHKLNGIPFWTLSRHGFAGAIHLVNPKYKEIDGIRCYPRVDDLPGPIDAALVMVRAAAVPETIRACGRRGIANAVVLSSGFEETAHGGALVDELRQAALESGVTLIGPNCEGIWSVRARTILTFGSAANRDRLFHGPTAVISQSGSVGGAVVRHLQDAGHGCSYFVSVGNETLVDAIDFLEWVVLQDDVRVVLLFLEGLSRADRLPAIAAKARARGITLVALKSGASAAGLVATASHTGKAAAPYRVYSSVLMQCGILQVNSIAELVEAAEVLTSSPLPANVDGPAPGVGVFSIPGGTRALTADACETLQVPLATFADATVERLEARLPRFGYSRNPTDITGQVLSDPALFTECLDLVADDPNVEALIVQFANRGPHDARKWRPITTAVAARTAKPLILTFLGDMLPAEERRGFAAEGLTCARDPADAVKYLSWLYRARQAASVSLPKSAGATRTRALPHPDDLVAWKRRLAEAGIGMPHWCLIGPAAEPVPCCEGLRFPLAVKALPSAADHKTEAGLLRLGIASAAELRDAVTELRQRLPGGASLLAQEMVVGGVEAVLSVTRNRDFGPLLAVGAGGVLVELIDDIAFMVPPFDEGQVANLVARMKLGRQLAGFRGAPVADLAAFCRAAVGLMDLFLAAGPEIDELELNPVFVLPEGKGVVAVDLLARSRAG